MNAYGTGERSLPRDNLLLAALPDASYRSLQPHLESFPLHLHRALSQPGDDGMHAYFPTAGIVALLDGTTNGGSAGLALVGNEGMVGVSVLLGGKRVGGPLCRAVVHSAGHAYRLRSDVLLQEFERGTELQRVMLRATQALITQIGQTAVCNRHHTVAQQLARWLLMCLDRAPGNDLRVTQERLASMLGVRRESVTAAAAQLQRAQLIDYSRGRLIVLDRRDLERYACECYAVARNEYARLLTQPLLRLSQYAARAEPRAVHDSAGTALQTVLDAQKQHRAERRPLGAAPHRRTLDCS